MQHLDPPDPLDWDERRLWFEEREAALSTRGVGRLSEQASALLVELQCVFCAGAWATAIILSAIIVETQANAARSFRAAPAEDLRWLRGLRNRLLHEAPGEPVLTIEDHWTARGEWEKAARRAIGIALSVVYPERPAETSARGER